MNGAYQIINFDDIEFTTGTAELVVGAYKKITDTAKRFVITHLNLDDETYKDIQLTFENVEGTFVGTGVVNGKLAVVSIASTDQVTVSLNDIAGNMEVLENEISLLKSNIISQVYSFTVEDGATIDSGAIGSRAFQLRKSYSDIYDLGYEPISASILFTNNSSSYIPIALLSDITQSVFLNTYRATTDAVADASTKIVVTFKKRTQ